MNGLRVITTVILCGGLAYLMQMGWGKWRESEDKAKLIRNIDALKELREHTQEFLVPEVLQVAPNVYVAIGYALANSIMIEGQNSVVIVDVTESLEAGQEVMAAFRNVTKKPVSDIAFIEDKENPPDIWAHNLLVPSLKATYSGASVESFARSMRQFGVFLPEHINSGIGPRLRFDHGVTSAMKLPNNYIYDKETNVTLAGIDMRIIHIPGETDDQIGIWIPDQKILLCADDMYKAFPNLYAIRGTTSRNLKWWVESLDTVINLQPEIVIPSHTKPLIGRDWIKNVLTLYRDAIQYVHDQTIRGMNLGMHPDDIANSLKLPDKLATSPFLREMYGTVFWSSKAVFTSYFGWFSGDPVDLYPMKRLDKAKRMVALARGEENALITALEAIDRKDYQWALELSSHVLTVNPSNQKARDVKVECLSILGSRQSSANGRNYYLTSAFEEVSELPMKTPAQAKIAFIDEFDTGVVFDILPTLFKPEECGDKNVTVLFQFTDTKLVIGIHIRNSVAAIVRHGIKKPDIRVTLTEVVWRDILTKRTMAVTAIATGDMGIDGGILAFKSFFDCFEQN